MVDSILLPPPSFPTMASMPSAAPGSPPAVTPKEILTQFSEKRAEMLAQLRRLVVGQGEVIEQILAAIFTRGHCLLIGVPGLAKTLMVSSISQILDVGFKRVQFTPDLMPADITGTTVLDENEQGRREFRYV